MSLRIGRRVSSPILRQKFGLSSFLFAARSLSSSVRLFDIKRHESNQDKVNKEIRKLKTLKDKYRDAGFFERLKLRGKLMEQEARVTEAQSSKEIDDNISIPSVTFSADPLDIDNIKHYEVVYAFMLSKYIDECKTYTNGMTINVNPDSIIEKIITQFKETYPKEIPITKDDVLFYFNIYYGLLNNVLFLDELKFENDIVSKIQNKFVNLEPTDDLTYKSKETASDLKLNENVVEGWFNIFKTLSSVPFSDGNERFTCAICPYEYARFKTFADQVGQIERNLSKLYGNHKDKSKFDETHKSSLSKNNKTENEKKNGNKDKKQVDFEINLNSPTARYFQIGILGGLLFYMIYSLTQDHNNEISFQEFTSQFLNKNLVSRVVVVNNKTAVIELNDQGKAQYETQYYFNIGSIESFERSLREVQEEFKIPEAMRVPVVYVNEGNLTKMLINFLPTILFLGAIYYMTKKASMGGMGGPLGFGKSIAKKFNQDTDVKIRFKDVAGMKEAKEEVMEFVKFLKNPEKYEKLGAKIPRGAILSGPPGTGKTLIAKATAGEAGVPFYSVSGSEFVEMFVGVGASRVRDLFKTARENAPSIVFVDEIDAIGKQRSKGNASGANDERETTLNQLLVEMDGFDTSDHVVVLAGTNRVDILDKALMRPGRFDRHITIDNPELQDRKEIFDVHLKKIKLVPNIDPDLSGRLAALTPGFSGADIANVCNEAALIAARYNAKAVALRHFELAIERVIGGVEKKSKVLNPEEQKIVAYHEAGHAVCGWYLKYAHPLLKVSIIPRGQGALGYAQYLPPDQYLMSALQLYDRMIMTLGGRVSEELHFSSVTSGAHDDFKKVTGIAQAMVLKFGMSKKIGMVNYADTHSSDDLTKPFSDETNEVIDEEIKRIVNDCYNKCRSLLKEKAEAVELVAQELLKKEFITREDMIRLLGKRPWPENNDAFDKYLEGRAPFADDESLENDKKGSKDKKDD
ncbi:uncharacterized protein PRCAT00005965001 [Priceomyces carsonii]|uniref:uncharacterized protein n=1 Tax=Priceomyces carsonii TaxID=28549 RepID=UPI002EDA9A7F|nr:unnamed protein product [Priceomyces carsonii]